MFRKLLEHFLNNRHPAETVRRELFFREEVDKIPNGYYAVVTVELKPLDFNPERILDKEMAYA